MFGSNRKAQVAAKTMFSLAHRHGDILREGWKNIMDSMLQLFRAELLPKSMVEVRWECQHITLNPLANTCVLWRKWFYLSQAIVPPTVTFEKMSFLLKGRGLFGPK